MRMQTRICSCDCTRGGRFLDRRGARDRRGPPFV